MLSPNFLYSKGLCVASRNAFPRHRPSPERPLISTSFPNVSHRVLDSSPRSPNMFLPIGCLLISVSIALAAPQVVSSGPDVPLPTNPPPGINLPPLNILTGKVRPVESIEKVERRAADENDSSLEKHWHRKVVQTSLGSSDLPLPTDPPPGFTPEPLNIKDGGVRPLIPITEVDAGTADNANRLLEKRRRRKILPTPPADFTPPPLVLKNGGVRTLEVFGPLGSPVSGSPIYKREEQILSTSTFTTVFPSSGASGIIVTEQFQIVTTYDTTTACQSQRPSSPTLTKPSATSCFPTLIPAETTVCATTVSPLAAPPVTVTECGQYITYGSQYGYHCTSDSETVIQTDTTYSAAIWTDILPGVKPTTGIEVVYVSSSVLTTRTFSVQTPAATPSVTAAPYSDRVVSTTASSTFTTRITAVAAGSENSELRL